MGLWGWGWGSPFSLGPAAGSLVRCGWHGALSGTTSFAFEAAELFVLGFCSGWSSLSIPSFLWEMFSWLLHGWNPLVSLIPSLYQASSRHWWIRVNSVHVNSGTFTEKPHSSFQSSLTVPAMMGRSIFVSQAILCNNSISKWFLSISAGILSFNLRICLQKLEIFSLPDFLCPDPCTSKETSQATGEKKEKKKILPLNGRNAKFSRLSVWLVKETISGKLLFEVGGHTFSPPARNESQGPHQKKPNWTIPLFFLKKNDRCT